MSEISNKIKKLMERKDKASLILTFIFAALIIFGIFVFAGMYVSSCGKKAGFLEVSGRIEGYEYHTGTKIGGKVSEMYVEEGDLVKAGQEIARIQSKQAATALQQARSRFELAETEYDHYERLLARRAVARFDYDRVRSEYLVAKEAVQSAEADMEDTHVVAPVDGTVVTKIVRPGEVVAAGTPLVTVVNMGDLYLKVFLATEEAGKVSLGDEAKVFPDAFKKGAFDASVNKISEKAEFTPKNVETKSQRAKLVFEIKLKIKDNIDRTLKPGMPASGVIKIDKGASWKSYKRS